MPGLPDAPADDDAATSSAAQYFIQGPRLLEYLGEMKREVLADYDML